MRRCCGAAPSPPCPAAATPLYPIPSHAPTLRLAPRRGAHAREDFPDRDDKTWMKHTLAWIDDEKKKVNIDFRPVHTYTMTNEVSYIEPKARVY